MGWKSAQARKAGQGRMPSPAFTMPGWATMRQVTVDTNCLIFVKQGAPEASDVLAVQDAHRAGRINLRVVAASATEIKINGERVTNFVQFTAWLASIGFADHEILKPIAVTDIAIYGEAVYGGEAASDRYEAIWSVLVAGRKIARLRANGPEFTEREQQQLRNLTHDALMMWAHLHYGGDVFVTNDTDDFRRGGRGDKFLDMGAGLILTPAEAAGRL